MEIAMLVLTIISTLVACLSLAWMIKVKKETSEIKKHIEINIKENHNNEQNTNNVNKNEGVIAKDIIGGVNINGRK